MCSIANKICKSLEKSGSQCLSSFIAFCILSACEVIMETSQWLVSG